MKIAFICGPYRGNLFQRIKHIFRARRIATALWRAGYAVLCPHLNSALMNEQKGAFLEGYLTMLARCDIVVLLPGWLHSEGCLNEVSRAGELKIPIIYSGDLLLTKETN